MYKRDIINFLFIISFPVYGIGTYVSASISPSLGYLISCSVHLLIVLFYCIDLLYTKDIRIRANAVYVLMCLFLLSSVVSLFVALHNGLPDTTMEMTVARSILLLAPFHSFMIVSLYNQKHAHNFPRLTMWGLSLLLAVNLAGYFGLGLTNATHSIEGRLNLPFLDSFYSGAGLLAIINLMILFYLPRLWPENALGAGALAAFFILNLVLFYRINSRLAILIFLFILVLYTFRLLRVRGLYLVSLFTLPVLLSSGTLLYKIMQLPVLQSVVQRADVEDVITFHGRAYLWEDAINWLLYDQRGLLFGNGYRGQFFLDLVPDVVKLWNVESSYHLHLHSTSLEILVCQGIVFLIVFCILFYRVVVYYRQKHREGDEEGSFFAVALFLLFIMQVDTFVYLDGLGFVMFALLASKTAITGKPGPERHTDMNAGEGKPLGIEIFRPAEIPELTT